MDKLKNLLAKVFDHEYTGIQTALDIGTGSGIMALTLAAEGIRCITVDKSANASIKARENLKNSSLRNKPLFMQMNACKLSFIDNSFELVTAYRSFHHIENAFEALKECVRVCCPGGTIIIVEHDLYTRHMIDFMGKVKETDHPHEISLKQIQDSLETLGCTVGAMESDAGSVLVARKADQTDSVKEKSLWIDQLSEYRQKKVIHIEDIEDKQLYYNVVTHRLFALTHGAETEKEIHIGFGENNNYIKQGITPSLCLNVANQCNLSCKYCYASGGNYGRVESLMSEETAFNAIKWYRNFLGNDKFHVIFFGGEPLLQWNLIKNTLSKLQHSEWNNVTYSTNTNGTLLNKDIIDTCIRQRLKLSLSIDGNKHTHDNMRVYKNGKPTYDDIIDSLSELSEREKEFIWVRVTITKYTQNLFEDIMHLISLGFKKFDMSFVTGSYDLSEEWDNMASFKESFDRLAKFALEQWVNGTVTIYPFIKIFEAALFGRKPTDTCTSGREMISIQPDGSLVPCFRFSDINVGEIDGYVNTCKLDDFELYKKTQRAIMCEGCWVEHFCGGFCPKDIETMLKIQPLRCSITQYIVRRSLFHLGAMWLEKQQFMNNLSMRFRASEWLDKMKTPKEEKTV